MPADDNLWQQQQFNCRRINFECKRTLSWHGGIIDLMMFYDFEVSLNQEQNFQRLQLAYES